MIGKSLPLSLFLLTFSLPPARTFASDAVTCKTCPVAAVNPTASKPFRKANSSRGCTTRRKHGLPVPDPKCTPGAVNPTVTIAALQDPEFRTGCLRDCSTSAGAKAATYAQYGIPHPSENHGSTQTCELDHLVSLELGGADTVDNIWPQCGPDNVELAKRYFKQKDAVENYLAKQVRSGKMDLKKAQKKIASDWTQFLKKAQNFCALADAECKNGD
jgi:hypothetical protein